MNRSLLERLGAEVTAGAMTASVALPLCIAAGTLAYSPLDGSRAAEGAVAGIISAIIGGIVASVLRRSSFVTTIPTNPNAVIQASILAALLVSFEGQTGKAIVAFTACAALAGLLQVMVGVAGLARIIKLAPHPVIAGFVSGVGILIVKSQLPMFFGVSSLAALRADGLGAGVASRLPFGIVLICLMFLLARRAPKIPPLLAGLLVGIIVFHGLRFAVPGLDLGPLVGAVSLDVWAPANLGDIGAALWSADLALWRILLTGAATLALLGTLDTVFSLRAARNMADISVDESRDLVGQGIANVVSAMTGGLFVSTSVSLAATNYQAGGRTRASTSAAALILLAGIVLFPGFIFSLPRLVLSSILVVVGINVVDKSALRMIKQVFSGPDRASRSHARRNSEVVLAVALATFFGQPVIGAGVGVLLACVVFMIEMNRPIVRRRATVGTMRSKRIRSAAQNEILSAKAQECVVLELQGVLFFGNADQLASEIEQHHQNAGLLVLDFEHVTNVDASGEAALDQIANRLRKARKQLLLSSLKDVDLSRGGATALASSLSFVDLDTALEHAEEQLIADDHAKESAAELSLEETDFGRTMNADDLEILRLHMQPLELARGSTLSRAGDPSDRLWVITRGSIGIWVDMPEGRRRIASIGTGCVVGEMGLLNDVPRSADVCADDDVVVYVLTSAAYNDILDNKPRIGQAVLASIARQLADRLRTTTEELRATKSWGRNGDAVSSRETRSRSRRAAW